jgi:hypothetical protein
MWCEEVNSRRHRATGQIPADRLDVERTTLHVLPAYPLALALGEERTVRDDRTVTQLARNLVMDLQDAGAMVKHLIRDRESKYTRVFDAVFEAEGIEIVTTGIRVPRMNAIMERWGADLQTRTPRPHLDLEPGPPAPRTRRVRVVPQRAQAPPRPAQCGAPATGPRTDHRTRATRAVERPAA